MENPDPSKIKLWAVANRGYYERQCMKRGARPAAQA